ncbi:MAG: SDR family NAD(P)-dependent oxidoreductase [Deltaproteobacteria bacterium]|nr:SDR family NAD(P)-dependent oxidoreductase [Deltaproteobacteria bacterium]
MSRKVCVITGAGPANGRALAEKFAACGYSVALLARRPEPLRDLERRVRGARGYCCDVGEGAAVADTFAAIRRDLGPVATLLYNAGNAVFGGFEQVSCDQVEAAWRVSALGLFLCGREVVGDMRAAGGGAIVVTGATASLRGGANFAAFASAKAAQRSLAESMARSLAPEGIHVAYVIVDGVIDTARTRALLPDKPDDFYLRPDDIAESVYHVATQPRSAWTFQWDLRPFGEKW